MSAQVLRVHGGVPHTLAVPPPPQVSGRLQVPQLSELPQPSPWVPQVTPSSVQVLGVQATVEPHWLGVPPPPHVPASPQPPQSSGLPQPSPAGPQLKPSSEQVFGMHGDPHWLAVPPPPHVCPPLQVPHWMMPPHPSLMGPHAAPAATHVTAVGQDASLASPPLSGEVRTPVVESLCPPPSFERSVPESGEAPPSKPEPTLIDDALDPQAVSTNEARTNVH